jgi:hypothetical protein
MRFTCGVVNMNNTILAIWTPSQYFCIVKRRKVIKVLEGMYVFGASRVPVFRVNPILNHKCILYPNKTDTESLAVDLYYEVEWIEGC